MSVRPEPAVVLQIRLTPKHRPTGNTKHWVGGALMPTPASLRIVTYGPGRGFYLLYYDVDGKEMTDTFHDSIEQAMDQANFEFTIDASEWERPDTEPVG